MCTQGKSRITRAITIHLLQTSFFCQIVDGLFDEQGARSLDIVRGLRFGQARSELCKLDLNGASDNLQRILTVPHCTTMPATVSPSPFQFDNTTRSARALRRGAHIDASRRASLWPATHELVRDPRLVTHIAGGPDDEFGLAAARGTRPPTSLCARGGHGSCGASCAIDNVVKTEVYLEIDQHTDIPLKTRRTEGNLCDTLTPESSN